MSAMITQLNILHYDVFVKLLFEMFQIAQSFTFFFQKGSSTVQTLHVFLFFLYLLHSGLELVPISVI